MQFFLCGKFPDGCKISITSYQKSRRKTSGTGKMDHDSEMIFPFWYYMGGINRSTQGYTPTPHTSWTFWKKNNVLLISRRASLCMMWPERQHCTPIEKGRTSVQCDVVFFFNYSYPRVAVQWVGTSTLPHEVSHFGTWTPSNHVRTPVVVKTKALYHCYNTNNENRRFWEPQALAKMFQYFANRWSGAR